MGKASFEETMDNFLNAAAEGDKEPTEGVSASIICGKRASIGTGMIKMSIDIAKLPKRKSVAKDKQVKSIIPANVMHQVIEKSSIIIGKEERELEQPIYWRGNKPLEWPESEYLLIDSDYEFGSNFQILHVPGHTPGELSILLTLPNTGSILLTSDAISRESEISEGCLDATDPAQAIASANRILELAKAHNAYVIYGHGPEQWKELKKAPDLYN